MSKLFLAIVALAFVAAPPPAFAAKQWKRSCNEVCLERCATGLSKNACVANCPQRCELVRARAK